MSRCCLMLTVCSLLPLVSSADEVSESLHKAATPLKAPKPLIPLEQIDGPLPDDYVIAKLDGNPIRLVELFDVGGYTAKLRDIREKVPADELRALQEDLLKRDLRIYLSTRLFVREFQRQLSEEDHFRLSRGLHEAWQNELKKIQARYDVTSVEALEDILAERGHQSLSMIRWNFDNRMMAMEFVRAQIGTIEDRDERAKAVELLEQKLFAEADLQTVVDISKK